MIPVWRRLLLPLVPAYLGIVVVKRWLHDKGFLRRRHLNHPVISVGSLSAGGAGKTPVVLMLAQLLDQRGFEVRILTRGYGRRGKLTEPVDPAGSADEFGDEPLLLSRRASKAAVFVGRDRYRSGALSELGEPQATNAIYLLDDGFQHQKLARQVEVLLVTRQEVCDGLLPAGNLREPLRSIRKADFLVVREDEADIIGAIAASVSFALPPVIKIRRRLKLPERCSQPLRPLIFSGLARPKNFIAMLAGLGVSTAATKTFSDHHRYSMADMEHLITCARDNGADGFATTEKDAVKLTAPMLARLETLGPVVIARLEVELIDEASLVDGMIARLALHEKIRT